jgi:hypothetical protein
LSRSYSIWHQKTDIIIIGTENKKLATNKVEQKLNAENIEELAEDTEVKCIS